MKHTFLKTGVRMVMAGLTIAMLGATAWAQYDPSIYYDTGTSTSEIHFRWDFAYTQNLKDMSVDYDLNYSGVWYPIYTHQNPASWTGSVPNLSIEDTLSVRVIGYDWSDTPYSITVDMITLAAAPTLLATLNNRNTVECSWLTVDDRDYLMGFDLAKCTTGQDEDYVNFLFTMAYDSYAEDYLSPWLDEELTTYYYRVDAYNRHYTATHSAGVSVRLDLFAPSSVAATPVGARAIDVNWYDNSGQEDGYKIERTTDPTDLYNHPWVVVGTVAGCPTQGPVVFHDTIDTGLSSGEYFYRVRAYKNASPQNFYSLDSDVVDAECWPAAPTLELSLTQDNDVLAEWTLPPSSDLWYYEIKYSDDGLYWNTSGFFNPDKTNWDDSYVYDAVSSGKTYYFYIVAVYGVSGDVIISDPDAPEANDSIAIP